MHEVAQAHQADEVLVYMNLMLRKAAAANVPVRREDFKARAKSIALFDGVKEWFGRINAYAKAKGVDLKHFLISSGNEEIFAEHPLPRSSRRFMPRNTCSTSTASRNGRRSPSTTPPRPSSSFVTTRASRTSAITPPSISLFSKTSGRYRLSTWSSSAMVPRTFLFSLDQGSRRAVRCRVPAWKKRREGQGGKISSGWPGPCGGLGHLYGRFGIDKLIKARIDFVASRHALQSLVVRERMDGFRFNEKYLSQIPRCSCSSTWADHLTPEQALAARGGKPGQMLFEEKLRERLKKNNRIQ